MHVETEADRRTMPWYCKPISLPPIFQHGFPPLFNCRLIGCVSLRVDGKIKSNMVSCLCVHLETMTRSISVIMRSASRRHFLPASAALLYQPTNWPANLLRHNYDHHSKPLFICDSFSEIKTLTLGSHATITVISRLFAVPETSVHDTASTFNIRLTWWVPWG